MNISLPTRGKSPANDDTVIYGRIYVAVGISIGVIVIAIRIAVGIAIDGTIWPGVDAASQKC